MKERINRQIKSRIMSIIFILVILVVGTIYVYYPNQQELLSSFAFLQNQQGLYLEELSSGIKLAEAYPIVDEVGNQSEPYQFKIINNSNKEVKCQIIFKNQLDKIEERNLEPLPAKYLRYSLQSEDNEIIETLTEDEIIYETTIAANTETEFNFRLWLGTNLDAEGMGKTFIGQMEIKEI